MGRAPQDANEGNMTVLGDAYRAQAYLGSQRIQDLSHLGQVDLCLSSRTVG